ncbi:MAG: FKBP-type peptidyl-prolyl cis-trans isomerase [Bacteroidales bacterium]|nr:FKBP-type peptidyl-prolyl cis-trans isomerase [Bacteroidales bacterium]
MKKTIMMFGLMMGLAVFSCTPKEAEPVKEEAASEEETVPWEQSADKEKTLADYKITKAERDSVSYLLGINFGSFIKGYNFGKEINYSQMVRGIKDFLAAKGSFSDSTFNDQFRISPELINEVFNAYLEKRHNIMLLTNKENGEKFLAANKKKEGVVETESGLQYKIIEPGNDVHPSAKDTVSVHYDGTLIDGTRFDYSPEDVEPVRLPLTNVIKGWTEGLQLIGEGGKMVLYVPAKLGYGENGQPGIEPNSVLVFDITLVKVDKAVAEEETEE